MSRRPWQRPIPLADCPGQSSQRSLDSARLSRDYRRHVGRRHRHPANLAASGAAAGFRAPDSRLGAAHVRRDRALRGCHAPRTARDRVRALLTVSSGSGTARPLHTRRARPPSPAARHRRHARGGRAPIHVIGRDQSGCEAAAANPSASDTEFTTRQPRSAPRARDGPRTCLRRTCSAADFAHAAVQPPSTETTAPVI